MEINKLKEKLKILIMNPKIYQNLKTILQMSYLGELVF